VTASSGERELRPARTIEIRVRVRMLAGLAVALAAITAVAWSLHAVTSATPLSAGASELNATAPVVAHTADAFDTGQPVYQWTSGKTVTETLWITNDGRLPVTLTGFDRYEPPEWGGELAGPTPFLYSQPNANGHPVAFHPVRIAAGSDVVVGLRFDANSGACSEQPGGAHGGVNTQSSVTAHFTVLHVFHNSQAIALAPPISMRGPNAAQCAAAARP
jgi:hypothetical protein